MQTRRNSQVRAKAQYRSAVGNEMPSVSATSGMVRPAKKRSFTTSAADGIEGGESGQGFVERQEVIGAGLHERTGLIEIDAPFAAAVPDPQLLPGLFNQDAPHGLCGGGEEMAAMIPRLIRGLADEPDIGLMNQSGGLERLARLLLGQFRRRQRAQLVVDQRQQLFGGARDRLARWPTRYW